MTAIVHKTFAASKCLTAVYCLIGCSIVAWPLEPALARSAEEEFKDELRARDLKFNNVRLSYKLERTEVAKDYRWQFPEMSEEDYLLPKAGTVTKYVVSEEFIVRGPPHLLCDLQRSSKRLALGYVVSK
jgi:hypothetical protein